MRPPVLHPQTTAVARAALAATLTLLSVTACPSDPVDPEPDPPPPPLLCDDCDLDHPINALLAPHFQAAGITPRLASQQEVCARLVIDLTGAPRSARELDTLCAGRSLEDVLVLLQGEEAAQKTAWRHWADRLKTDDVIVDWRATKELFALIGAAEAGELAFDDLVVQGSSHPGLLLADFDARARVRRVFAVFLGRTPTEAEEIALSPLYRPWLVAQEADPDVPVLVRNTAVVLPGLCEPLATCETTLWGGAALTFENPLRFEGIPYEDLNAADLETVQTPGRLLSAQPEVYEAAVDFILDRFLDWDEGERDIRTPGFLFPEVRSLLANELRETGDLAAVTRLVLTSWLYTQTAELNDGVNLDDTETAPPPVFATGPVKPLTGEAFLDGALSQLFTFPLSSCDPRYSDGFPYFQLADAFGAGLLTVDEFNAAVRLVSTLREDDLLIQDDDGDGIFFPNQTFTFFARQLGGCPGFSQQRVRPAGVSYAYLQEGLVQLLCSPELAPRARPTTGSDLRAVATHQIDLLLSRNATEADLQALATASGCGLDEVCDLDDTVFRTCTTLLGSAEFLFR